MSTNRITKNAINTYLNELSKEIKKEFGKNAQVELVIVGGASVLINYDFRDSTQDIDAVIRARSSIKDIVYKVADRHSLPDDWLNSDFMHTKSYSDKIPMCSKYYRQFNQVLDVYTVDAEYLIAMKLASFREYKNDKSDIIGILESEKCKEINMDKITHAIEKLYGGWAKIPNDAKTFLQNYFQNKNRTTYKEIRHDEEKTLQSLRNFEKENKGVLNENNITDIINQINTDDECNTNAEDIDILELIEQMKKEAEKGWKNKVNNINEDIQR